MRVVSRAGLVLAALSLLGLVISLGAEAAAVSVTPTVETDPVHSTGDAADDAAVWIHPSDPSLSTVIATDKTSTGGLVVYNLNGKELYFYQDGRLNNVDVAYNFPLGGTLVSIVGATNRVEKRIDFYKVNPSDRSLSRIGSLPTSSAIGTPRGFCFYHSPFSGKFYAFVTDSGQTDQYEVNGASGSISGGLVRHFSLPNATEGLVADHELKRLYVAEEDIGGIWRYGAEPTDGTTGVKIDRTTEAGGNIVQDVKGLTLYYGSNGAGYLLAASQGGDSFHVYTRESNTHVGEFKIVTGNGVDGVTDEDGIDVTNFALGPTFPDGFFISQDDKNDTLNQNFKLVPWRSIANAFSQALTIDTSFDPRKIGAPSGGDTTPPDTAIVAGPSGRVNTTTAEFAFSATEVDATFACSLDGGAFVSCSSPTSYTLLAEGAHTFAVRASDAAGNTDSSPATRTWTVDLTPPSVSAVSPADGATSVSPATDVHASFSEDIDPATLTGDTFFLASTIGRQVVPAAISYNATTRTATLNPSAGLALETSYTATVTKSVRDVAGNSLGEEKTWSFTTGSAPPPPTAIKREDVAVTVNSTATNSIAIARSSATAAGDVLVACIALNGTKVSSAPAGWTRIGAVEALSNPRIYGYYRVAGSSEPAQYVWTLGSSQANAGGIARYSGVSTQAPLDVQPQTAYGAAATSGTVPGVTTMTPNAMLIGCMAINSSSTAVSITSPSGMAETWDIGGKRHEFSDAVQAASGPSGDKTWRFSSGREWAGWLSALRPQ
jgi:myo-inositol-hexaphosphate 3-phosphohydrolase